MVIGEPKIIEYDAAADDIQNITQGKSIVSCVNYEAVVFYY